MLRSSYVDVYHLLLVTLVEQFLFTLFQHLQILRIVPLSAALERKNNISELES